MGKGQDFGKCDDPKCGICGSAKPIDLDGKTLTVGRLPQPDPSKALPTPDVIHWSGERRLHTTTVSVGAYVTAPPSRDPIPGIRIKLLRWLPDERGRLMECLRADDEVFGGFGQVYVTTAYPGVVKGWHFHKAQTDNFVVLSGMLKLVCAVEGTDGWLVNEYFIGDHNPMLVQVPPMIWHGFKCISEREAIVMNISSKAYDHAVPDEYRRKAHSGEIPYDWGRRDG